MAEFIVGAVVALVAGVIGWALGLATELWRERRQARLAAQMVYLELWDNLFQVHLFRTDGTWVEGEPLSRAWEAHRHQLVPILSRKQFQLVHLANSSLNVLDEKQAVFPATETNPELMALWNELVDQAIQAAESALRELAPLAGMDSPDQSFDEIREEVRARGWAGEAATDLADAADPPDTDQR